LTQQDSRGTIAAEGVPPWLGRYRLFSLWEVMKRFEAVRFFYIAHTLEEMSHRSAAVPSNSTTPVSDQDVQTTLQSLLTIEQDLKKVNFRSSIRLIERVRNTLTGHGRRDLTYWHLGDMYGDLLRTERVNDFETPSTRILVLRPVEGRGDRRVDHVAVSAANRVAPQVGHRRLR